MSVTAAKVEDMVNHPPHYKKFTYEVIDMMEKIYGREIVANYCELNAMKYRMRAGHKNDAQQDIEKAIWYENKAEALRKPELPF